MGSKTRFPVNTKVILISLLFLFLLLLIIRTSFPSNPQQVSAPSHISLNTASLSGPSESSDAEKSMASLSSSAACPTLPTCAKTPPSLANAIVYYASTNITPQQTFAEISVSLRVLQRRSPCNFLVFGLGHDSLMWATLNHGGRTLFLEEDKAWIEQITEKLPNLEAFHVTYDTKVHQAEELLKAAAGEDCRSISDPRFSKCLLSHKGFPNEVYDVEWDLIMVDAPTGYHDEAPGRMTAIYTAGLMARNRESGETDVFVHDVDRAVEDKFSKGFLCDGYLTEQEGRLRHFTVPSHRTRLGRPFCPP
ncbi:hypothetical protein SAY87_014279 [Trapa incisa]|uniref:Polysaccharide biosynthesis domain-containing protein n=1 Tax=Trapa incisa TaxID=236973 RepID=A0AAN7GVD1_9MYRT|nr:hypothetical protein SAY87_014279 [Trapa incisa]